MESGAPSEAMQEEIKPRSFFGRLGGVYFSPGETFKEIGRSPGVLVPIVALIIISVLVGLFIAQKVDLGSMMSGPLEKAVAEGRMSQEQMEQQMGVMSRLGPIQLTVGSAFGNLLMVLVIAGVFKLISVIIGAENRFKPVFAVTIYALIAVTIVQSVLLVLVLLFKSPADITGTSLTSIVASNLGAVISGLLGEDALPQFLMRLAGWIDIFAIWIIALLAIGYAAVSRKLKTSTAAVWLGGLYAVVAVIGSAIGGFFG